MSAWAEIVHADSSDVWPGMCSRALDEVHREDAATVRAAKLREPQGYDDERLNRTLERLAEKIERGQG